MLKILLVNVIKGKLWDAESEFDQNKDKTAFRDYESACDRVKLFYKEQHGAFRRMAWCRPGLTFSQRSKLWHSTSKLASTLGPGNGVAWVFGRPSSSSTL